MMIELSKEHRQQALASLERYFAEHMGQRIGNVAAGGLLGFILEEIGPSLYNRGVADAQERMQARVSDLDFEVHEEEFAYWRKFEKAGKPRPR
jgi:uncharacterized protein (DUF2164 family)